MSSVGFFSSTFASNLGVSTSLPARKLEPGASVSSASAGIASPYDVGVTSSVVETKAAKPLSPAEDRQTPDPKSPSTNAKPKADVDDQGEKVEEIIEAFRDRMERLGVFIDPKDLEIPPAPPEIQRRIIEATTPELAQKRKEELGPETKMNQDSLDSAKQRLAIKAKTSASSIDKTI